MGIENNHTQEQDTYVFEKDLPVFFQPGYVHRTIDSLPENIPSELKEELKERKDDILVTTKTDMFSLDNVDFGKKNWRYENLLEGTIILNELCTSTLTAKIVYGGNIENELDSYDHYFRNLTKFLELDDTFVGLIDHLEIAMLSGDFKNVNEYLETNYPEYPNVYDLSHRIGMISNLVNQIDIGENTQKAIQDNKFSARLALFIFKTFLCQGGYKYSEGKIFVNKLFDTLEKFSARFAIRNNSKSKGTYIHEVIHYLSHEKTLEEERVGFKFFSEEDFKKLKKTYN
jgi:hypothetical protein